MERREETVVHILFTPEELIDALNELVDIPPGATVKPKWSHPVKRRGEAHSQREFLGVEVRWIDPKTKAK